MRNWKNYFDNLATTETEEYKKVGWGSNDSMYSKFYTAISMLPLYKNNRLLDIGCGTGAFEQLLQSTCPFLNIHAIDISDKMLVLARNRNPYMDIKFGTITEIPFSNSFFDCITCFGVLQNFNGMLYTAISEIARVLRKGGHVFIVTMDADYRGFKSGERKPNPMEQYYIPNELSQVFEHVGITIENMAAISSIKSEGMVVPLHHSHTFFILGEKSK